MRSARFSFDRRRSLKQLLQNVTDSDFELKNAGALSGGQKQRLAFIQAIISPHAVLFGDEPTGNLDWGNAQKVMNTLKAHIASEERTGSDGFSRHQPQFGIRRPNCIDDRSLDVCKRARANWANPWRKMYSHGGPKRGSSANGTISHEALSAKLKSHFEETAA